jgi:hypothetical protein
MFIFVVPTLQKKWNEIRMKELAGGKYMENDCFLRTLKFEMACFLLRGTMVSFCCLRFQSFSCCSPTKLGWFFLFQFF